MTEALEFYAAQSIFSDPGRMTGWLDAAPTDVAGIRNLATRLVFHYRANGEPAAHGFAADRLAEIDLRYADAMFDRLRELNPESVACDREPAQRILGCCRDFSLLFVAMARHRGIPARARVGFAGYFVPEWWIDHVIAEVWDEHERRWRLVEPQISEGYVDPTDGAVIDSLDVPRDRFLVGADAWRAARAGAANPERFAVAPDIDLPFLRSWTYLAHNLVFDLASLNRHEMILWESWGILDALRPPDAALAVDLDTLAGRLADPMLPLSELRSLYADERLRVPGTVTNYSPFDGSSHEVVLR